MWTSSATSPRAICNVGAQIPKEEPPWYCQYPEENRVRPRKCSAIMKFMANLNMTALRSASLIRTLAPTIFRIMWTILLDTEEPALDPWFTKCPSLDQLDG